MTDNDPDIGRFLDIVLGNPWNRIILERAPGLELDDWWLVSGCLVQTVWNKLYGHAPEHGIADYDLFYFDPDSSWEAEDAVIRRTAGLFSDVPVKIQIRNQARVPLWYQGRFGVPYPPVAASSDGIDRFPCATTAIGVRRDNGGYRLHAPFGVALALQGILLPNLALPIPQAYMAKIERWRTIWPDLSFHPWPEPDTAERRDPDAHGRG